ncbi:RmlC-like cupin domain-containing protein [Mycena latifolia]|nr:RmlC-like cupin domain-containing protein [Mycena latifolia]
MSDRSSSSELFGRGRKQISVTPEGQGALVRRSIGSMSLRNLTSFVLFDHFHENWTFPDHPHRGQATVTISSDHEDSAGHKGTRDAGGVQWMIAVRTHAEMPVHAEGQPDLRGLQLWLNLPKKIMVEPTYQDLGPSQIPTLKVISGLSHGVESPVRPLGRCWYFHYTFSKDQVSMFQDLPSGWTAFIYILKGTLIVGHDSIPQEQFHTVVLSTNAVLPKSPPEDTEFMLAATEPMNKPIVQYGPFVMNTKEEIQQKLRD